MKFKQLIDIAKKLNPSEEDMALVLRSTKQENSFIYRALLVRYIKNPKFIEKFKDDVNKETLVSIALNFNTPSYVLKEIKNRFIENNKIVYDVNNENVFLTFELLHYIASNQNTPDEVIKELELIDDEFVINGLLKNPNISVAYLIEHALNSNDVRQKSLIASIDTNIKEVLNILSKDESWFVRQAVAINKMTPVETLESLSNDIDFRVRASVAKNVNIDYIIILKLCIDCDISVKNNLMLNATTPRHIKKNLKKDLRLIYSNDKRLVKY